MYLIKSVKQNTVIKKFAWVKIVKILAMQSLALYFERRSIAVNRTCFVLFCVNLLQTSSSDFTNFFEFFLQPEDDLFEVTQLYNTNWQVDPA